MQHFNEFAGSRTLDGLIATSLARPDRNVRGDIGPRCPRCSGLGATLALGSPGSATRSTSVCTCEGSGLDLPRIERHDRDRIWQEIERIQRALGNLPPTRFDVPREMASRQYWMECVAWQTADGTAIGTTTTETIIFPNITIPANYMADGRVIRARLKGKYSTLGSGTVSHVYKVRWNGVAGTVLITSGTVTLLVSLTNALFELEFEIQTRQNDNTGSAGILMANGQAIAYGGTAPTIGSATGAPAVAPMTNGGQTGPAQVTGLAMNADTPLSVTLTHGASSASNTATGQQYTLESLN